MTSGKGMRTALVVVLTLAALLSAAAPSRAFVFIECRLAATATQSVISAGPPAIYDWDIVMIGECAGDQQGRYAAFGSADGTSEGLGFCDGSLLVQNLDLDVALFLDSTRGPKFSKFLEERWFAPITTFPIATPFLVEDVSGASAQLVGGGVLSQHIFLNCSPTASPSTLILRVGLR